MKHTRIPPGRYPLLRPASLPVHLHLPRLFDHLVEPMTSENIQLYHCLPIPDGDWKDVFENQAIAMAMIHNGMHVLLRHDLGLCQFSAE